MAEKGEMSGASKDFVGILLDRLHLHEEDEGDFVWEEEVAKRSPKCTHLGDSALALFLLI